MRRRGFLAMSGGATLVGVSVYTIPTLEGRINDSDDGSSENPPDRPENMDIETKYVQENIISTEYSGRDIEHFEAYEESYTLLTTETDAEDAFVGTEKFESFIDGTDFSDSYLLVVQTGMQSMMSLELDGINLVDDGIRADITVEGPETPGDDLITHSLLIRITDEVGTRPESVFVNIEGYV